MTAEAIAEVTHRPLYIIASGELGDTVESIHKTLKRVMELTEVWKAVLLLDEADTMLCQRSDTDLTRNAIVSVFLRELEYYQGILILTTNRAEIIDKAFFSRIHFSLKYPELDEASRKLIWHRYLKRAEKDGHCVVEVDDQGCGSIAKIQLNGREIKNIVSILVTVAEKRRSPINLPSVKLMVGLCLDRTGVRS